MQIYGDYGYPVMEAVESIVTKNLYGLDIDDRAAQLAYFTIMMKARSYDRGFFRRGIQPNVMAIQESNWIDGTYPYDMGDFLISKEHQDTLNYLLDAFNDAKEYGSILQLENRDYVGLLKTWEGTAAATAGDFNMVLWFAAVKDAIPALIKQAIYLSQKYDVVVTNPPYMGSSNMSAKLSAFVKKNYPDSKSDLFACFIERCGEMSRADGYVAMITQHAWMFLSSFENLRKKLLKKDIVNMSHLGARAFEEIGGEVVQTTSMVFANVHIGGYKGIFVRLIEPTTQDGKEEMFLSGENRFSTCQENFAKIPGAPVAYWVSENVVRLFNKKRIIDFAEPRHGMSTGNNDLCLKLWHEVNREKIFFSAISLEAFDESKAKYAPYKKGGEYRLWYGNNDYVIAYDKQSRSIMQALSGYRSSSISFFFKPSINWSDVSSSYFGVRVSPNGFCFDGRGASMFCNKEDIHYLLGVLVSKISSYILNILNPTLTFNIENISAIPVIVDEIHRSDIEDISKENISLSKSDWDSRETSWDFERHPLV